MNYLEHYAAREPNKIVSGYNHLDTAVGYRTMLRELDTRFGEGEVISMLMSNVFFTSHVLSHTMYNVKALDAYVTFLAQCESAARNSCVPCVFN